MFDQLFSNATTLILVAIFVEALVETYKKGFPKLLFKLPAESLSVILGVLHCYLLDLKIFVTKDENLFINICIYVLTGFVVSRGSNFIHNIIDLIKKNKPLL